MEKGRLEAFSDGVIAIIITIMVLTLKLPYDASIESLQPMIPVFVSYVLSFIYVGIYWNNHHHMFQAVESVNGKVLWANLHLLFWLSLIPFVTDWMGENHFAKWPVIFYGIVLVLNAIAYAILVKTLIRGHDENSLLAEAFGNDTKGKVSVVLYAAALGLCFLSPWLGLAVYALVAGIWFIPDKRIENKLIINERAKKKL
ncbi:TMEM175 family protein [Pedobacter sp. L105]|uniref:TMEM175 family protein n=1 Tax=Pedobacter sp. L105 TaxID=1641871 RepID=UPI00131D0251|nr:TMEM175 family protein [Pedobacter sp. L105]